MKFAKGYNQKRVDAYTSSVLRQLDAQPRCNCRISVSTYGDLSGRPICNGCGRPIKGAGVTTVTTPYWYYKQGER